MSQPCDRYPLYRPDLERDACGVALVADARGRRGRDVVDEALTALVRMTHRGAPPATASIDGAGILTQIPWEAFADDFPAAFAAGGAARALGVFFMPRDRVDDLKRLVASALQGEGFGPAYWRTVPVCFEAFDRKRRTEMPAIVQVAALAGPEQRTPEPALYRARLRMEAAGAGSRDQGFAVVSLSTRTVVYKGLLTPAELPVFFPDLRDPLFRSAIAIVHQRFSTNTAPQWRLAQPFHVLAHNGEIATVAGNRRWAGARLRASGLASALGTIADVGTSDSSSLDAAVSGLCAIGLDLPHALARLIPPAWENDTSLPPEVAAFYEYQSCFSEPWDGPAAIAFTDGEIAGALLDRNGFRPARFLRTRDDRVYVASEAGVFDVPGGTVTRRGRLAPGGMLLVDTVRGDVLETAACRGRLAARRPYRLLRTRTILPLAAKSAALEASALPAPQPADLPRLQQLFGYTQEEIDLLLRPAARDGAEAIGSMGDDAPLAPMSRFNRLLPDYFRQRFAQVTNPAMDPLRERCVMSLRVLLGGSRRPLLLLPSPILEDETFGRIAGATPLRPVTLDISFDAGGGPGAMEPALQSLVRAAVEASTRGARILILTDRRAGATRAAIPALLATAAVHEGLHAAGRRLRASLVVDTGEVRDAHQLATLCAYGASAVYPYLALATVATFSDDGLAQRTRYHAALESGLLKILSKMGVTTFAGYCGSGLFDAIGLDHTLVRRFFPGAGSPLGGATVEALAEAALARQRDAHAPQSPALPHPGFHTFRRDGEQHAYEPAIVRQLHKGSQPGGRDAYEAFNALVSARRPVAIRDLLEWTARTPIALDAVEPVSAIVRRFFSAAMSIGALSPEAHETLGIAMNRLGGRSNSGEGGEPVSRTTRGPSSSGSAIKQVASARFGVTPAYLRSADELQIKIAQGSKPGEGGQLPAAKVVEHIAQLRHARAGMTLISPPVHHDIYSIEDLAQLIFDLRRLNPAARIGVKLVASAGVGIVAAGAAKAGADAILVSGYDGGTGASPRGSIKHAGLPWEIGLAEAHQVLTMQGLRDRVVLQVDGGLQRGRDVAIAAALGADEFGFGTAALVAIGCVMARQCHLDTCPAGIATQRPDLRAKFAGTPEMAIAFLQHVAEDVRRTLAAIGLTSIEDLVGRADLLQSRGIDRPGRLDLSPILTRARRPAARRHAEPSSLGTDQYLDDVDLPDDIGQGATLVIRSSIRNVHRTVGTALAGRIAARFGDGGLADGSVVMHLAGSAGQSLGAFLVPGIAIHLCGEANDYVGKGMHGGTISIRPIEDISPAGDVRAGNAVLYGATGGSLFVRGAAGERFAVRNSGAVAVVEGIGDHGCEYMTGGIVVNLGPLGRNFASGMTGGVAYLLAEAAHETANVEPLDAQDWMRLEPILSMHWKLTGSPVAAALLGHGGAAAATFVRLAPRADIVPLAAPVPAQRPARAAVGRQAVAIRS